MAEIDKIYMKHLTGPYKSTKFALDINDYGEKYDIVQAQDVRPIAQMEKGAKRRISYSYSGCS